LPSQFRQPAPQLHRIICRHYDRACIVEGAITVNPDGTFNEVEPMVARPMSWEEMGLLLEENR
jgi:hypothetical protein